MASGPERRKYERYDTKVEVYFRVAYDVTTKVKFQIKKRGRPSLPKYPAVSRNVSAEGLSFVSEKNLGKGEKLFLEVYLPKSEKPLEMEGEVRWSEPIPQKSRSKKLFETGLKIVSVQKEPVAPSIYFDNVYQIIWSILLESVLGNFRIISEKLADKRNSQKE